MATNRNENGADSEKSRVKWPVGYQRSNIPMVAVLDVLSTKHWMSLTQIVSEVGDAIAPEFAIRHRRKNVGPTGLLRKGRPLDQQVAKGRRWIVATLLSHLRCCEYVQRKVVRSESHYKPTKKGIARRENNAHDKLPAN